jgi:AcrR family transcriptional regulator
LASAPPASEGGGIPAQSRQLRSQGKKTIKNLLDAAIVVFGERGYHNARVDDIAKRAHASHGTFYLYFSSKEDLFRTLVADVTQEMSLLAESMPAVVRTQAGYRDLRAWLARFYDLYEAYNPVIRAWMEANVESRETTRMGALVLRNFADQLVVRVLEIEPAPVSNPEVAALAMVSMVERMTYYSVIRLVPLDRDEVIDNMATILHVGLFGGTRRARSGA